MSVDSTDALHKAIVSTIRAIPQVQQLGGDRVVDWPSEKTQYPCAAVGDFVSSPWDAGDFEGCEIIATLHTFAKGANARTVARQLGEAICDRLDERENDIQIQGHRVVLVERQMSQVIRDETSDANVAGSAAHGIYRFRFLTAPAE